MAEGQIRESFLGPVTVKLKELGFTVKLTSKGKGAQGYIVYEYINENKVRFALQLTITSYLSVTPSLQITYKEVELFLKNIDKNYVKTFGGATFNSHLFEFLNPANSDGYLNQSAGNPYIPINKPHTSVHAEVQGADFTEQVIIPSLSKITALTSDLVKADAIINTYAPIKQGKNRLLTSVLSNPIPLQMIMSLTMAELLNREIPNDLLSLYSSYVKEEYDTDNSYVFMLEKVINAISSK